MIKTINHICPATSSSDEMEPLLDSPELLPCVAVTVEAPKIVELLEPALVLMFR